MSPALKLSVFVAAVFGLSGSVVGYVIGGPPGEIVGIFLAVPASVLFGVWTGVAFKDDDR